MPNESNVQLHDFIESQRKAGHNDEAIEQSLMQAGWDRSQVVAALSAGMPVPPRPNVVNQSSQTGNTGTPVQVENVQYSMKVKPVESKIGLYTRLANMSLWFTVVFICIFLVTIVEKISGHGGDITSIAIITFSLSIVTVPIFVISNKKRSKELDTNPELIDDLFFKKSIRNNLYSAIVLTAISVFGTVSTFLFLLFKGSASGRSFSSVINWFIFAGGFGAVMAVLWPLHARTKR